MLCVAFFFLILTPKENTVAIFTTTPSPFLPMTQDSTVDYENESDRDEEEDDDDAEYVEYGGVNNNNYNNNNYMNDNLVKEGFQSTEVRLPICWLFKNISIYFALCA